MNNLGWSAIAALTIFLLTNLGMMIYWSARVTTILERVKDDLADLTNELKAMRENYVHKEQFTYRIAQSDKEHDAMWKRVDAITKQLELLRLSQAGASPA